VFSSGSTCRSPKPRSALSTATAGAMAGQGTERAGATGQTPRRVVRRHRSRRDRTLAAAARRSDVARRLMTTPGVGPVTTLAYIATVDDPGRFGTSKALGAHLDLTPRVYQSGEIDRSGQISKCGDRMLRHLLYEAASALITRTCKWSRLRAWGVAVAKRSCFCPGSATGWAAP
jgi:transposase